MVHQLVVDLFVEMGTLHFQLLAKGDHRDAPPPPLRFVRARAAEGAAAAAEAAAAAAAAAEVAEAAAAEGGEA